LHIARRIAPPLTGTALVFWILSAGTHQQTRSRAYIQLFSRGLMVAKIDARAWGLRHLTLGDLVLKAQFKKEIE